MREPEGVLAATCSAASCFASSALLVAPDAPSSLPPLRPALACCAQPAH